MSFDIYVDHVPFRYYAILANNNPFVGAIG